MSISILTLYSGSKGNSVLVSHRGVNILFDAGRSAKALCASLSACGLLPSDISAVFVTHEHIDHISALDVMSKKCRIPIHMTEISANNISGKDAMLSCVVPHSPLFSAEVGGMRIESFSTYHDSAMSVGYTVSFSGEEKGIKFGLMTDTGHYTGEIFDILSECTHLVLEANHDIDMLRRGPYPRSVQDRILSDTGHLSNEQCAELAATLSEEKAEGIVLAHLSENNNTPELAYSAVKGALDFIGSKVTLSVAGACTPTVLL